MLEERGLSGRGDEHLAVGTLGLPGLSAGALLDQPLQSLLGVCSCQRVAGLCVRGSELFFLTEVVMIHVLMVVLALDKEEGEDAA